MSGPILLYRLAVSCLEMQNIIGIKGLVTMMGEKNSILKDHKKGKQSQRENFKI